MATRSVFVPDTNPDHTQLVHLHEVDFQWEPGRSAEQMKQNITKLHTAAGHRNLKPLLEVSSATSDPLGIHIRAANLAIEDDKSFLVPLLAAFHGSKVFTGGGPFTDLYRKPLDVVTGDQRLTRSGEPIGFRFMGLEWGPKVSPLFYDWLVLHAVHRYKSLRQGIRHFAGFTEIDFKPQQKSVCHARSCAVFVALAERKLLDEVLTSQDRFIEVMLVSHEGHQPWI